MVTANVTSAFAADQTSPSAASSSSPLPSSAAKDPTSPAAAAKSSPSTGPLPSPTAASKAPAGAHEHHTRGNLADALNRTLSWDLPQPPRRKEKIRQNITNLHPPASAPLNEDGLPTPEPFKVKMVETIT